MYGNQTVTNSFSVVSDGSVKYEEADVDRSAMGHFIFYFCKMCHALSFCETLYFVSCSWSRYFALCQSYVNITKLLQFKMAAKRSFEVFAPKR